MMSDKRVSTGAPMAPEAPAGRPIPTDPESLLFPAEAAYLLGCAVRTLETKRLRGGGPPFIKLGVKSVRYQRRDLMTWIEARQLRSTSDTGDATSNPVRRGQ